jgi:chromate reductase
LDKINIPGIVGSLRKASCNHFMLKAVQELVPDGAALDLLMLQGIPAFDQDDEITPPAAVPELKRRILAADVILFVTPEYNYSLLGGQ